MGMFRCSSRARISLLIELRLRVNGQHIDADQCGVELVADVRGGFCAGFAAPGPGDAGQIEEAVMDAGPVQPLALFYNIGGGIALIHKAQGFIVASFDPYGQAVISGLTEGGQLLVRLGGGVCDPCEAADGLDRRDILVDQAGDGHKPAIAQREGVCPGQKDAPDGGRPVHSLQAGRQHRDGICADELNLPQIALHVGEGRHSELKWQIMV